MHITELRLSGFKSFVDGAKAPIEAGLTGVVGPNGCGKSNLLEAVRWVMGATSAKSMRADDMDEVIFAGSGQRPAREHAEVMLVLADAAGRAPGALASADVLEVSRRIKRGAGSTYRINGKEVRAKDVQLLFADAATGANSPALVRQGQVSDLIAAKPENRRRIIEDAAGIAGLHARRHEADLKLRAAETNLTRLEEIVGDLEMQASNLRKQARQAERYRGLAETMRQTEALLFHRRWTEAREALASAEAEAREAERVVADAAAKASAAARAVDEARDALPPLREEDMIAAAVLRRLEGVRVGLERDLAEAQGVLDRADSEARRARDDIARAEATEADASAALARLTAERETLGAADDGAAELTAAEARVKQADEARIAAEAALETKASEAAAARARAEARVQAAQQAAALVKRLADRNAALAAQLAALPAANATDAKREAARAAAEAAQAASAQARDALAKLEAALAKAAAADDAAWGPYRAAETAERDLAAEVRALDKLAPPDNAKFPPVLASIEVDPGFERALAAALGDDLDASTHKDAPARWAGATAQPADWPKGVVPLADHVKAPEALAARLARVGVAENEAAARAALAPGVRVVTKDGALWRWDGFVRTAAAPAPAAAKLEHKNRLASARKELAAAEQKLAKAKAASEAAKAERQKLETAARAARAEAPKFAAKAAEAAQAIDRLDAEARRDADRRADLETQRTSLAAELAEAEKARAETEAAHAPAEAIDLTAVRAAAETARAAAAEARAMHQGLVRERSVRENRLKAIDAESADWTRRASAAAAHRTTLEAEIAKIEKSRKDAEAKPETVRAALAELMDQAENAEARRRKAADAVAEAEAAQRNAEALARIEEAAHAAARETRAGAEARRAGAAQRVEDISHQAEEATSHAVDQLADLAGQLLTSALGRGAIHEIEKRLERLRAERDAGGPVNLRAEEELREVEEKASTIVTEKEDVAAAVAKLRGAITRLNNEGRARLMEAFEIVNRNFGQLFGTLFEGGQAALKLTENEDPLAAGLEIFAQPPGKKLSHLSLMSGGEQALTATALIFAVFLANPAPLCVLDEVDAPLDDANVDRFCRLLDEMRKLTTTRFICITHNPVTMSRMDRLYGVTMPEQGVSQLVSVDLGRAQAMAAA